ncbi:MAG: cob(I)yrinic acid a,c-diamide adenosyltransferase [Treponema sp.]|nr:cob(I)yrinic acid a,c-diamide adenosyltransferase [Treponema sp.]
MIHLYCGEGKGKTTAALGLAVRALGNGFKVIFVQFMKNTPAGEILALERLGATVLRGKAGNHFFSDMTEDEKRETKTISDEHFSCAIALCKKTCAAAVSAFAAHPRVLLVLDEICAAYQYEMIDRAAVDDFLRNLPVGAEIVLTGRNPPQIFFDHADYITEMKKIRHPFDSGIPARKGVEF